MLIAALVLLFAGAIVYSVLRVGFQLEGRKQTEGDITELSLTHRVERDKDGNLSRVYYPGEEPPEPESEKVEKPEPVPAPEAVKQAPPTPSGADKAITPSRPEQPKAPAAKPPAPPEREPPAARPAAPRPEPKTRDLPPGAGKACPT